MYRLYWALFCKNNFLGYICFWNKAPFFCDMFLCFITWPQICFVLVGRVNVEVLGVTGCFSCRSVPCGGLLYSPGGLQRCIPHALFSFAVVNLLHLRISPRALSLMHILWESLWLKASCGWGLNFLSELPRIALKWRGLWTCWFLCLHCCSVDLCERRWGSWLMKGRSSTAVGLNGVWVVFVS